MAATTTLLGLVTPTQGTLTGTWGDTVNYGITEYLDIAIAGTLTLTGDGTVILANTTGSSSGTNITSTLSGAGTVTAQFAIVKVSGTTGVKIVQAPSFSRTYLVVNASSFAVTFKPSSASGVSIAAGETASVYYNGTDYVKVVGTATAGAAGGSNTQVQYNNAGVLAGITGATSNGTALTLVAPNLGSPNSVGTMPAFTLGGTVSGGGNQINNVIIGTTTPLAGSFTTLTTSSTVTHNGGTANGVAYLDASKVLTTGSALTFSGTVLSAVGGGYTDAIGGGNIQSSDGTRTLGLTANFTSSTPGIYSSGANPIAFYTNSTERGRFTTTGLAVTGTLSATGTLSGGTSGTAYSFSGSAPATSLTLDASGNLGIGTSSPNASYRLDVNGNSGIRVSGSTVGSVAIRSASGYSNFVNFNENTVADRGVIGFSASSGSMQFRVNGAYDLTTGTRAMDIDSSGNLLVGVATANANGGVLQLNSGITFPATAVAATDANTLDDYEEGTWSAGTISTSNVTGASFDEGRYTKIGNIVHIQGRFSLTITTANALTYVFMLAPFTPAITTSGSLMDNGSLISGTAQLNTNGQAYAFFAASASEPAGATTWYINAQYQV